MNFLTVALLIFCGNTQQEQSLKYIAEATNTPYNKVVVFYLENGYTDETYDHFNKIQAEDETAHFFGEE